MKFHIEYAAICHKGLIRGKNQDNFWCANTFLESVNDGLSDILTGTIDATATPAFAVFDGMGGEQQGEMAAHIAASHFHELYRSKKQTDTRLFLLDTCSAINRKICEYQSGNHIKHMGTTAAVLIVGQKDVYACNIGDSRIYRYSGCKATQISCDHSEKSIPDKKAPLTQNLGIPETEFVIEPYIAEERYLHDDRYLLCSDGLTDMVSDGEIASIITGNTKITDAAKELLGEALEKGGVDNITIILCELHKQKWTFRRREKTGDVR